MTCAAVSAGAYLIAGAFAVHNIPSVIALPFGLLLMILVTMALGRKTDDPAAAAKQET
jgi:hypothetical protein